LFGTQSLQEETIKQNGKKIQIIRQKKGLGTFNIGESKCQSETFLPNFAFSKEFNSILADIAGSNDSNGFFIETINNLILKSIFNRVKNIRFIVLFTIGSFGMERGMLIR